MRRAPDEPAHVGIVEVSGEPPGRKPDVDLVGRCENHIPKKQTWPTHDLLRLRDAPAKGGEQRREAVLFFGLGSVVSGPVLLVGDLDGLRFGYGFGNGLRVSGWPEPVASSLGL